MDHLGYHQNHLNHYPSIDLQCVVKHRMYRKSNLCQNQDKDEACLHPRQEYRNTREQLFHWNQLEKRNSRSHRRFSFHAMTIQ